MYNKTFTTLNYKRFKLNNLNRPLDEAHINKLMRSIKKYGLLVPILVDKNDNIVDGQHRYEACRRLEAELTVQVRKSYSMEKIVEVNSTAKTWTLVDYAHHYASSGNTHYQHFLECVGEYPSLGKMSVAMACACEQINTSAFRNGSLICRDKQQTDKMLRLMHVARGHGMSSKMHHVAIMKLVLQGHPVQCVIDNLGRCGDHMKVEKPRNHKDALRVWQDIFNWKRRYNKIQL